MFELLLVILLGYQSFPQRTIPYWTVPRAPNIYFRTIYYQTSPEHYHTRPYLDSQMNFQTCQYFTCLERGWTVQRSQDISKPVRS